jgi:hypothetical protein
MYKKVSAVQLCTPDSRHPAFLILVYSCCGCCGCIHLVVRRRADSDLLPTAVARRKKCDATCYYNMRLYFAAYDNNMKRYNGKPYEPFNYAGQK